VASGALGGFGGRVEMGAAGGRGPWYVDGVYGRVGVLSLTRELVLAARVLRVVREPEVEPLGFGAEDVAHL
jgi:hypothetical protein